MDTPPKFKFKILASFQDPLTRQIAESVRIEGAGEGILNSKSEYSRCRVPRLRLDMEGWIRLQKEKATDKVEVPEDDEEDLGRLETQSRRQESKRALEDDTAEQDQRRGRS